MLFYAGNEAQLSCAWMCLIDAHRWCAWMMHIHAHESCASNASFLLEMKHNAVPQNIDVPWSMPCLRTSTCLDQCRASEHRRALINAVPHLCVAANVVQWRASSMLCVVHRRASWSRVVVQWRDSSSPCLVKQRMVYIVLTMTSLMRRRESRVTCVAAWVIYVMRIMQWRASWSRLNQA
jgi:hypothetical protein